MIAVIGGGLTGLTCAIRLAKQGHAVHLFEAAPQLGGRTRSFHETKMRQWVDNGPHLLSGAYRHTQHWLAEMQAEHVHWQPALSLTLWEAGRRLFRFAPSPQLPLPLAMAWALTTMPGHGLQSALGLMKMARGLRGGIEALSTAAAWMDDCDLPQALRRDLLTPLCLGIMNESPESANARSFARTLRESFASHSTARLGWFTRPLSEALIRPLEELARRSGVQISTGQRIRRLHDTAAGVELHANASACHRFQAAVLAIPPHAAAHLLDIPCRVETRPITNVHLWFEDDPGLPDVFVGGIDTTGQWFFDVSRQMQSTTPTRHICAVISADERRPVPSQLILKVCAELQGITGRHASPLHARIVREQRATVLVRPTHAPATVSDHIINAC
ncbi:MAG: FAD-dependent oxidoreductase, partial [Mariprofundaceae bacterium]|nr:FAD-dependent oxidoreductase [Mariprofundaceae bacterium]